VKAMVNNVLGRFGYKIGRRAPLPPAAVLQERHVRNCRVVADREAILERMPKGGVVAELGVGFGDFSAKILDTIQPCEFHAIDHFDWHEMPVAWGRSTKEVFDGHSHEEFYRARFSRQIGAGIVRPRKGCTWEVLAEYPDAWFDVIYVDAAHDYASVKRDADCCTAKLKPDGVLIFNDYILYDYHSMEAYGVVHAVNDLCVTRGYELIYLALAPHMFCDVAIRKAGS
jgi:methyltransferase family protein